MKKGIIRSILDTDIYKFSMQFFSIQHYSEAEGEYTFNNRDKSMIFTQKAVDEIQKNVKLMSKLKLTNKEYDWMKNNLYFLPISYRQYLAAYRFNPDQVFISLTKNGELEICIKGKWRDTILWEVPLMAIISEVYFKVVDKDWSMNGQIELAHKKAKMLSEAGCLFADFGSRRRRNFKTQDLVVNIMRQYPGFVGTSNPYLAMKYNVKALGTCAHEAIGAVAALESLNHPNKIFMEKWSQIFFGSLGTMLTDTYSTDSFLKDFSLEKAKLYDGVRQDSGCEYIFTDKMINHYKKLGIDPITKTIIFSNNLDDETAVKINEYCKGKILCSFGIGTFFTSFFMKKSDSTRRSKAMNMVIKLTKINNIPVIKLSDSSDKANGDPKMIEIMKYIHLYNYQHNSIPK